MVQALYSRDDIRMEENRIASGEFAELAELAELFKVFGDSTRIRILYALFSGEKNVTELCNDLTMNQSAVSHQLKILRTAKLVHGRREGKSIVYDLADEHVKTIIATGIEHIEE